MGVNKYRRRRQQKGGGAQAGKAGHSPGRGSPSVRLAQRLGAIPSYPSQAAAGSFGWMGEKVNGSEQLLLCKKKKMRCSVSYHF